MYNTFKEITDHKERAVAKARAISEVTDIPVIRTGKHSVTVGLLTHVGDGVQFDIVVKRGSKDVTPSGLNPIIIHNPPTLVDDPNGDIDLGTVDDGMGHSFSRRGREDHKAALVEVIREVVRTAVGETE